MALMDARSIAATAANKGFLTPATEYDGDYSRPKYFFDKTIYENRVFDSHGVADPATEIQFGPNIKDWPSMPALPQHLILKVVSEIHDPVTTTDELIPSGRLLLTVQIRWGWRISPCPGKIRPTWDGPRKCRRRKTPSVREAAP